MTDGSLTTKDVKNRSLLARDFKAGQLPAGTIGPQGPKGEQGLQGLQGLQGANGNDGAPGEAGSATAFAVVDKSGGLYDVPTRKNVDRATRPNPDSGFYCVHTTVIPNHVVVSLYGQSEGGEVTAFPYSNLTGIHCTAGDLGYNVIVHTYDSAGGEADRSFSVLIN